jgi:putative spermidine/putrescine transport system permease protein
MRKKNPPQSALKRPGAVGVWVGTIAALVLFYLIFPILIIVPLSFSSAKYLSFPPPGFSLQWYQNFFGRSDWLDAVWLSIWIGLIVMVLATGLGTPAALGLVRGRFPGKTSINAFILSPLIAPVIIVAIGVYFFYAQVGLIGTPIALILVHTCLAVPFVVINVSATLQGLDERLEYAAMNLGATPWGTFWQVTLPIIRPGVLAGALFAFISSFDELIVALFISGSTAVTLPRKMWQSIRFEIDPTIAAVSTILIAFTGALFLATELFRRRSERLRTSTPAVAPMHGNETASRIMSPAPI